MATAAFTPYQIKIIGLMSHVKTEAQMKEISHLLSHYFAQKAIDEVDSLWECGTIDAETLEGWKNERMRTPYQ